MGKGKAESCIKLSTQNINYIKLYHKKEHKGEGLILFLFLLIQLITNQLNHLLFN